MYKKRPRIIGISIILLFVTWACGITSIIGQPDQTKEQLFQGVTYVREVRSEPHDMVYHVITVDLRADGIKALVTPGDPDKELPLSARTTSEFLSAFDVQIAVNGDGFQPWSANPLNYFPKSGDNVAPLGFAASRGTIYQPEFGAEHTLYIYKNNKASINNEIGKVHNAISGNRLIVDNNEPIEGLSDAVLHPRTALGLDRNGRTLIIVVVDGRQPGYSDGASLAGLAEILIDFGAWKGINMDGGGSTTLVIQDENGNPQVLNSPIHQSIPGNERPVGNQLGIFAREN